MTWTSWCCWTKWRDSSESERKLVSNLPYEGLKPKNQPNRRYAGNAIKTTKYSFWSFIPMNLYEQFHRWANLYFVGIAVLNFVPAVNAFQPQVALIPICIILSLTAIKDAWEDFRRYQSDRQLNGMTCLIYSRSQRSFVERRWKDVRVGDFVRVLSNEIIPADILLLHTSDPNGVCHMETANLDGETNLKQRKVVPGFSSTVRTCSIVVCEKPNDDLNHFNGFLEEDRRKTGFGIENLLLRGCTVRNTADASGIVVYAGHETKSMLNNNRLRYKRSKLEKKMNTEVLFCVLLLICMCLIVAVGHAIWLQTFSSVPIYFVPNSDGTFTSAVLSGVFMFLTMIILLQVMIPISLYLSIELVKMGQVFFITQDADLYDEEKDTRVQCRALNITEDLGQIQYIFSDKTGTLTENKMVFRRCTIMGTEFPHEENGEFRCRITAVDGGNVFSALTQSWFLFPAHFSENHNVIYTEAVDFCVVAQETEVIPDHTLVQLMEEEEAKPYLDFFLAMAICNTVVVSTETARRQRVRACSHTDLAFTAFTRRGAGLRLQQGPDEGVNSPSNCRATTGRVQAGSSSVAPEEVCYEAQSPDEAALVHAAKAYGFTLLERTPDHVTVRLPSGKVLEFKVLDVLSFDSIRRRMSIIVRHPRSKEIIMYTKGADSGIMDRDESVYLHIYIAYEICKCMLKRQEAMSAISKKEELLMDTADDMENNLTLLGATGIEDRLQENVPETIQALREAGIQVWVLTGDKLETAVNIAYSCKLLDQRDLVFTFNMENKVPDSLSLTLPALFLSLTPQGACKTMLNGILQELLRNGSLESEASIGLVIDGRSLSMLLDDDLQMQFVQLCTRCRSVLCCRATPLQKSRVVTLLRRRLKVMTLAIGDGANDVNMIQAADVGVGISGQEGMQAVMASDFAISRFKHLKKLLLVHGHWCYTRLANMIIYFFYKNAYVNLLFWYQFFCGFSGTAMIDYWFMIFFNLIFTSSPPIMFGIMDREVSAYMLLQLPELYKRGQHAGGYRRSTFWIAILDAFYQSLVCFFVPYWTYAGSDIDIFTLGIPMNTVSLFTIILHLAIEIKSWTVVHWVIMVGSVIVYFVVSLVFSALCVSCNPPSDPYWLVQEQVADPMFYLVCILTTVVALLPRYTLHALRGTLVPSDHLKARQKDQLPPHHRDRWLREYRSLKELCASFPSMSSSTVPQDTTQSPSTPTAPLSSSTRVQN
uniref:Phospholipid-transporting ATPase n=1 Tax=Pygocentrus nattereri TaxID=42514 RepID=A0AAR2KWY8_PYGNA